MDLLKQRIYTAQLNHTILHLNRNDFIKQAGSIDTNLYLIKSGTLRVYNIIDSEEQCLYFGHKDSAITAIDSFFSEKRSDYFIQAIKKAEVIVIQKNTFMEFINSEKENLQLWQAILVEIIQHHIERGQDLLTTTSADRYTRLMKRAPYLFQEFPHKYIASYLRMSPETLSRLKKS
ncbi:MAG: Crp/Fnr family transcriptional regulator [Flavobacteriales bacterium]|nr:Crp/Fnr family transcriptional regulator [Flavobacteriales bacterium]